MRDKHKECIFIVDDEVANLRLLSLLLKANGFENSISIQDSREVISSYLKYRPSLIFLDLKMPFMDGFDVIDALYSLNEASLPPIVVVSAFDDDDYVAKAFKAGASNFLTKPFEAQDLKEILNSLLPTNLSKD